MTSRTVSPIDVNGTILQARLGRTIDWSLAKQEFSERLRDILTHWSDIDPASFTTQISEFPDPPHTVQRLAELLDDPHRWYTSADKFARAMTRVLSVTSTTVDFEAEKEKDKDMLHTNFDGDESILVPIPWLQNLSIDEIADPLKTPTRSVTTVMPNGVSVTMNGHIEQHMLLDVERSTNGGPIIAPMAGSAPIDAADCGPQSEAVQETILNSSPSTALGEVPISEDSNMTDT